MFPPPPGSRHEDEPPEHVHRSLPHDADIPQGAECVLPEPRCAVRGGVP